MTQPATTLDPTFRNYSAQQAARFAANRPSYSPSLYEYIIRHHTEAGNGQFERLVDVGCGPGNATKDLALYFDHATGVDPGAEMIAQATKAGSVTKTGEPIIFEVIGAEELEKAESIQVGTVDLISSAMAAHWFRMDEFWAQAAKVLKPGGTVALWTCSSLYCHPLTTPNAKEVQKALSFLEDGVLDSYQVQGNRVARDMYDSLTLPWQLTPPVTDFPEQSFVRRNWQRGGQFEPGETEFFSGSREATLARIADGIGTASMVTRWREANPTLANTDQDAVTVAMKNVARAMGMDSEDWGKVKITLGQAIGLLLFTKR